ncbi:MAG: chemotaxis protein CheW [Lachnospiraceae bacterium]|nr:chemotaxis protein CheW [Lachnospiraceae bacterium]
MDINKVEKESEVKQYIVVTVGVEQYGIDISYVDNIVRMQKITRVPKSLPYFDGVINLRGEIIPIMSLRKRFNLEKDNFTDKTRIIILKPDQQEAIGIIVDLVKEVINLSEDDIDKMAIDAKEELSKYIFGIGKNKSNNTLISLLNINNVIAENQ